MQEKGKNWQKKGLRRNQRSWQNYFCGNVGCLSADEIDIEGVSTSSPKPKRGREKSSKAESENSNSYSLFDKSHSDDDSNFCESELKDITDDFDTCRSNKNYLLQPEFIKNYLKEGDFVIVHYEQIYYPGLVTKMPSRKESGFSMIDCMTKIKKSWKWPEKMDLLVIVINLYCFFVFSIQ